MFLHKLYRPFKETWKIIIPEKIPLAFFFVYFQLSTGRTATNKSQKKMLVIQILKQIYSIILLSFEFLGTVILNVIFFQWFFK